MRRLLAVLPLLAAVACSNGVAKTGATVEVVAAIYPLAELARDIGGPDAHVTDLAKPGVEPHDLELTPGQVTSIEQADLVVMVGGDFQPAVADVVPEGKAYDVRGGASDPHVWLDPVRMAEIARGLGTRLGSGAVARGETVAKELERLDTEFEEGLRTCARREIVTSHEAFGHLAGRYGLRQIGIAGFEPDADPSPKRIEEVARFARTHRVTTIFFEELVSPKVAQTLAREVGAKTAVLDPLESAPESGDYFTAMRANLATLRTALGCT